MGSTETHGPRAEAASRVTLPRVSVILPVRNGMPYLQLAVESILDQTFGDFELIIMDDASTDSTPDYLASLTDRRVRLIRNEQNLGVSRTLNKALSLARGDYIARQDADDISFPRRLEEQVAFLDTHPRVGLLGADFDIIDGNGAVIVSRSGVPHTDIEIKWEFLFGCAMPHSSIMVRPCVLSGFGYYPEAPEYCYVEDYELWSRITNVVQAANLPETLVQWRTSATSVSSRHDGPQRLQLAAISMKNMRRTLRSEISREALGDVNALFRSPGGHDPQLSALRLRRAVGLLSSLQHAFYAKHQFSAREVANHRHHSYRIWGKHLLALSIRGRGGVSARLTLLALGGRYILALLLSSARKAFAAAGGRGPADVMAD